MTETRDTVRAGLFEPEALQQLETENRSLKSTIELLTHCREISAQLEFQPLCQTALQILSDYAGAGQAFFVSRKEAGSETRIVALRTITRKEALAITERIHPIPANGPETLSVTRWIEDIRGPMLVVNFQLEHSLPMAAVLTFDPQAEPPRENLERLRLIANQTALALENAAKYERARSLTFVDDVTGLNNMRYLEVYVDKELRRATRQRYPVSFLFMDLDHFKEVNDSHGHLVGSRLLSLVAGELKNLVRDFDVVVRYGGDEFVVVLINTARDGALHVAERIRKRIEGFPYAAQLRIDDSGAPIRVSASIGIACFPEHAADRTAVIRLADEAMYRAKQTSRNAVCMAERA